jgi:hypothetical protein
VTTPEQIRAKTEDIFARREFRDEPSWLTRLLTDFVRWLAGLYTTAPLVFWALVVGCALVLLLIVVLAVYGLRRSFARQRVRRAAEAEREAAARRGRLSAAYRAEAHERAARGEFTEAIRFLFLSLVYRFDEKGRVGFQKAFTNHEYLDRLGPRLPVREQLQVFVDLLDDHWYGQHPSDAAQYEQCLGLYERLAAAT